MLLSKVNKLHNSGVISDDLYKDITSHMKVNAKDELTGFVPGKASLIYTLEFNVDNFNLIDLVCKSVPWLGADHDFPDLFGKYGYTLCGLYDDFIWFRKDTISQTALNNGYKPLEEASEEELWKMLALSERYWGNCYKEWFHKKEDELLY